MRLVNPFAIDRQATPEARAVLRLLVVAGFVLSLGFNAWSAVFNNFAVDVLGLDARAVGWVQSLREIPGLLGFLLGLIVLLLPEMRLVGLCVSLLGVGLLMTGGAQGFLTLLLGSLVMSVGFHFFDSANSSLVLTYARKEHAPKVLGSLASIGAAAAIAGTLAVAVLAGPLGYRSLIYLLGGVTLAGGLLVLALGRQSASERLERKVVFRERYWLFYLLTFLMGCRRHIFTTFAVFLLVQHYHLPVQQTAVLFLANSVVTTYSYHRIGHLTARIGERAVLAASFLVLAVIFTGYAYLRSLPVLILLFVIDNVLFGAGLALNTYFQKIAISPQEITANVSMAQTVNHLSAVFVPALGGMLWRTYGHQATFMSGTAIVLVSLVLTWWVRPPAATGWAQATAEH